MKTLTLKTLFPGVELSLSDLDTSGDMLAVSVVQVKPKKFTAPSLVFSYCQQTEAFFTPFNRQIVSLRVGNVNFHISHNDAARVSKTFGITNGLEELRSV